VRLRVVGSRDAALDQASALHGAHIEDAPVLPVGRLELLHYLREQSVSRDYHRYGNLGVRGLAQ
jgi:RHH-type proline utilization regulon transcriptional repressor/proline dehydrogenase/delta 1-pyrroline-5-carboxylate dehydrogenase